MVEETKITPLPWEYRERPFVLEPTYIEPTYRLPEGLEGVLGYIPKLADILMAGIRSPTAIPGYHTLRRIAEEKARELEARYIGAGLGWTPHLMRGLRDIYGGMMTDLAEALMGRQMELAGTLLRIPTMLGKWLTPEVIYPEIYVPAPSETKVIEEIKKEPTTYDWLALGVSVVSTIAQLLPYILSDIKLKEVIEEIKVNDKIDNLHCIKFNYSFDKNSIHYGIIAQEIEKEFPELIKEIDGVKMVNYIELIPILLQAIKELKQEIKELKNKGV